MIRFSVARLFEDRRTHELVCRAAALRQDVADQRLEMLWRQRVVANVRRRVVAKRLEEMGVEA